MRRFLVTSVILGLMFVGSWIDFFPVRCESCHGLLFRTNITSILFGGYGSVRHQECMREYVTNWTTAEDICRPATPTSIVTELSDAPAPTVEMLQNAS